MKDLGSVCIPIDLDMIYWNHDRGGAIQLPRARHLGGVFPRHRVLFISTRSRRILQCFSRAMLIL